MTVPHLALRELGGAPELPVLVLGPSLGTSTALWQSAAPLLATRFRLLAWDLPGHGDSPPATAAFSVAELADAVLGAVDSAVGSTVDRAVGSSIHSAGSPPVGSTVFYAGVSLGGATGLELMLRHGGRVRAAAIVASGAQLGEPTGWHERAAKVRAESTSSIIAASAKRWFAPASMAEHPRLTGLLLHDLQNADDESYALCCEALAGYDVRDRLGAVGPPVLALWGESDAVAPEAKAAEIAAGVADGRIAMIGGAAHLPPAEQPAATAAALIDFFESNSEGTTP